VSPRGVPQHARPGIETDHAGAAVEQLAGDDAGSGASVADNLVGQGSGDGLQEVVDQLGIGRTSGVVLVGGAIEELHRPIVPPAA
jgi:hypothetical protein